MMRDLTTSRVPRVRWKPASLSQHDLETDLRFQAGGHGTVLGHAQLHEPLSLLFRQAGHVEVMHRVDVGEVRGRDQVLFRRSEEHTSELQSRGQVVCRLLLATKNKE